MILLSAALWGQSLDHRPSSVAANLFWAMMAARNENDREDLHRDLLQLMHIDDYGAARDSMRLLLESMCADDIIRRQFGFARACTYSEGEQPSVAALPYLVLANDTRPTSDLQMQIRTHFALLPQDLFGERRYLVLITGQNYHQRQFVQEITVPTSSRDTGRMLRYTLAGFVSTPPRAANAHHFVAVVRVGDNAFNVVDGCTSRGLHSFSSLASAFSGGRVDCWLFHLAEPPGHGYGWV